MRTWCWSDWRCTYLNTAAKLFGRLPHDLIGKHVGTEFPEAVGQPFHFHLAYELAMAEQRAITLEACFPPCDRWIENRIYPSTEGDLFFTT